VARTGAVVVGEYRPAGLLVAQVQQLSDRIIGEAGRRAVIQGLLVHPLVGVVAPTRGLRIGVAHSCPVAAAVIGVGDCVAIDGKTAQAQRFAAAIGELPTSEALRRAYDLVLAAIEKMNRQNFADPPPTDTASDADRLLAGK